MKAMFNKITQVALPTLTITSQFLVAAKLPGWGLAINLMAQPFWLYASWKSYKQAGQIGLLITTILYTSVTALGVVNYWIFR